MKKSIIKSSYCLQVIHDGSSLFIWTHPLKNRFTLFAKDLTRHPLWNPPKEKNKSDDQSEVKIIQTVSKEN
jgi:hypothetical protein